MAAHIKLRATLLVTLLLSAEAYRVSQVTSIHGLSSSSNAQNSTKLTAVSNGGSVALTSVFNKHLMLPAYAMYAWPLVAPAAAPVAIAGFPGWAAAVSAAAALKGVGLLGKPIITKIAAQRAGQAVVVAATRTGLISQAASKLLPWAFTATPVVGQAFMAANIAMTGWQLFQLQAALKDPTKLCALLAKIPNSPLSEHCAPGAPWGPPIVPPAVPAGLSELVKPEVALAVLTMLVIAGGGAWAWHRHSQKAAYDQAFCPRSTWEIDPQFVEELPGRASLESDAENGMSKCSGYYYKAVPVDCALDDVPCRHLACQQACCDRKGCVAYQFTNTKSILNFTSGMGCYLTTKLFRTNGWESDCEARWFGEIRSNFDPELDETLFSLVGMWDPDPERLREEQWTAVAKLGHQVAGLKRVRPLAVADVCDAVVSITPKYVGRSKVDPGLGLSDPRQKREECERDQCREACVATRYCIFYQYQRKTTVEYNKGSWQGVNSCHLGISHELKSWRQTASDLGVLFGFTKVDDAHYMQSHPWKQLKHFQTTEWYGGQRFVDTVSENGCDGEQLACPSNNECVASCQDCEGFALPGEQGACERAAAQAICDPSSWVEEYKGLKLNEVVCSGLTATGMITTTVKMDEDAEMSGHDLCREACCAEPQCKLYQVHKKYAGTKQYKKGNKIECKLGMLDSQQAPKFKCVPGKSYEGGYLFSRGCPADTLACPVTNDCVASCEQCSGAALVDASGTSCTNIAGEDVSTVGEQEIDKRKEGIINFWKQDDADPTAVVPKDESEAEAYQPEPLPMSGDCLHPPCLDIIEDEGSTFFLTDLTDDAFHDVNSNSPSWTMSATAETVVKIASYREKILPPEHVSSICSSLTIGAFGCDATEDMSGCRCSFAGFKKQRCVPESTSEKHRFSFFRGSHHLIPIFTPKGIALFSGKGCTCKEKTSSSDFHWCTFKMMRKLPKIKLNADDEFSLTV